MPTTGIDEEPSGRELTKHFLALNDIIDELEFMELRLFHQAVKLNNSPPAVPLSPQVGTIIRLQGHLSV
jgi:hypothetical protein